MAALPGFVSLHLVVTVHFSVQAPQDRLVPGAAIVELFERPMVSVRDHKGWVAMSP
jgi:hypothetical protein